MSGQNRFLPRDAGSRIVIGCVALFFGYVWCGPVFMLLNVPQQFGWIGNAILAAVCELLIAAVLVMTLLVVWAIAAPAWIETTFRWAWRKLHWTIAIAVVIGLVSMFFTTLWNDAPQ